MITGSLQVKNGIYQAVLNLTDENGKKKQKWISTKIKTSEHRKREAQKLLNELIEEYSNKPSLAAIKEAEKTDDNKKGYNFVEYIKNWVVSAEYTYDTITYQGYKNAAERHIIPYFEKHYPDLKIEEVTGMIVQGFSDYLSSQGNLKTGGALSGKSVRNYLTVLSQVFDDAMRKQILDNNGKNPVSMVKKPKKKRFKPAFYTESQMKTLFETVKDEPLGPMIIIAGNYGLRRSEVLGLKWDSLNFENKEFTIKHVVSRFITVVEKDDTKTENSYRTLQMTPEAEKIFVEAKRQEERNRKLFGADYVENDYIFKWDDGRPFTPDYVTRTFKKILKKYNLPEIRFHDLRHSCASLLIEKGCNLRQVMELLGHADIQTTGNVYGHLTNDNLKDVISLLSKSLF